MVKQTVALLFTMFMVLLFNVSLSHAYIEYRLFKEDANLDRFVVQLLQNKVRKEKYNRVDQKRRPERMGAVALIDR